MSQPDSKTARPFGIRNTLAKKALAVTVVVFFGIFSGCLVWNFVSIAFPDIPSRDSLDITRGELIRVEPCSGSKLARGFFIELRGVTGSALIKLPCTEQLLQLKHHLGATLEVRTRTATTKPILGRPHTEVWEIRTSDRSFLTYQEKYLLVKGGPFGSAAVIVVSGALAVGLFFALRQLWRGVKDEAEL